MLTDDLPIDTSCVHFRIYCRRVFDTDLDNALAVWNSVSGIRKEFAKCCPSDIPNELFIRALEVTQQFEYPDLKECLWLSVDPGWQRGSYNGGQSIVPLEQIDKPTWLGWTNTFNLTMKITPRPVYMWHNWYLARHFVEEGSILRH